MLNTSILQYDIIYFSIFITIEGTCSIRCSNQKSPQFVQNHVFDIEIFRKRSTSNGVKTECVL